MEEATTRISPEEEKLFDEFLQNYADERGKTIKDIVLSEEFDILYDIFYSKSNMMKKETKSFMMKAIGRSYTLVFSMDAATNQTTVDAIDMESPRLTFMERLKIAASIISGSKNLSELVFPFRLRNSDFYNCSFIYRPEKKVEVKAQPVEGETPVASKTRRPGRPRSKKTKETNA